MYITSIDQIIPFSKRHPKETIRVILRYDSGYIKDLLVKTDDLVFSEACFKEIQELTKGHKDNWTKPKVETSSIFGNLKPYAVPYLYDFNDDELFQLNQSRLKFI